MLCDICAKNQATVHLTEIIDEQMNELHLCEECAHQKSIQMEQQFGLSDLLGGLAEFEKPAQEKEPSVLIKCLNCSLTYAEFKKIGRLGCSECYGAFKKYLGPLLKKIHGSNLHFGKSACKTGKISAKMPGLQELRYQLQKAIETESFEEAAKIRDQIRELEKKCLQNSGEEKEKDAA